MNRLKSIRDIVIAQAFPELRDVNRIGIAYDTLKDCFMDSYSLDKGSYYIKVDKSDFYQAPDDILAGGIAHELGHVGLHWSRSRLSNWAHGFLYTSMPYGDMREERTVDTLVIKRGLGSQLLSYRQFCYNLGYEDAAHLTMHEIQKRIAA